ncbi:phosphotransferase family protein [Rhodopseudomonas palustris]|uniref:Aminoglycoside phosphotransferase n=1 Tax=Rhodopseudomonas palustris (strain BisB18) TaxID=316056 RepID=Q21D31_RHOPB
MDDATDELATLIARGLGVLRPKRLHAGAEAVAYELDDARVLKVYHAGGSAERFATIASFYARLNSDRAGFAVPRILTHGVEGGRAYSVEKRLLGEPLSTRAHFLTDTDLIDAYLAAALRVGRIQVEPEWNSWTMFGEQRHGDWHQHVRGQIESQSRALARMLQPAYWERLANATADVRQHFDRPFLGKVCLIHGDFHPGNVLVGATGRVLSLVDFGAFTTFGDAAFDVATACGYFSMYEPDQATTRRSLVARLLRMEGSPPGALVAMYLKLAAFLTCTAYPDDRVAVQDTGHFQWAMSVLFDPMLDELVDRVPH